MVQTVSEILMKLGFYFLGHGRSGPLRTVDMSVSLSMFTADHAQTFRRYRDTHLLAMA